MQKKIAKRLNLHRETLALLTARQAEAAQGGGCSCTASFSCPPPPTGHNELSCLC